MGKVKIQNAPFTSTKNVSTATVETVETTRLPGITSRESDLEPILFEESSNTLDTDILTNPVLEVPAILDSNTQNNLSANLFTEPKYRTVLGRLINKYNWTIIDVYNFIYKYQAFPSVTVKPNDWPAVPSFNNVKIPAKLYNSFKLFYEENKDFLEVIYKDFVFIDSLPSEEESSDLEGGDK
jgi:hypothetical protein